MKALTLKQVVNLAKCLCDDIENWLQCANGYRRYDIGEARRDLAMLRKQFVAATGSANGFPREVV